MYHAEKQNDGTYTIKWSEFGANSEIVQTGIRGCNVNRTIDRLYTIESQLAMPGTVIMSSGAQTLERTHDGRYVVSDGWITDWVIFYDHAPKWAHDGTLAINKRIRDRLNRIAHDRLIDSIRERLDRREQ